MSRVHQPTFQLPMKYLWSREKWYFVTKIVLAYYKKRLRTVPGIQGFIILQKLRLIIIYIRESDVISSTGENLHVGTPNDRSTATGPVTRYRHFDLMSFSSDQVASQWSLEDGTAIRGVHGVCLRGVISFLCMFCSLL